MKITVLELIARGIPETILFLLASLIFSKKKLNINRFAVSVVVYAILVYIIRLLPVENGVNIILTVFVFIFMSTYLNKISIINSTKIAIPIFILQFVCEAINMTILQYVLKYNLAEIMSDSKSKIIWGIPSLVVFAIVLLICHLTMRRKE